MFQGKTDRRGRLRGGLDGAQSHAKESSYRKIDCRWDAAHAPAQHDVLPVQFHVARLLIGPSVAGAEADG